MAKIKQSIKHDSLSITISFETGAQIRWFIGRSSERVSISSTHPRDKVLGQELPAIQAYFNNLKKTNTTYGQAFQVLAEKAQDCQTGEQFISLVYDLVSLTNSLN